MCGATYPPTKNWLNFSDDFWEWIRPERVPECIVLGADVHARDKNGCTALHHATANKHDTLIVYDVIKALLKAGADGKAEDKDGKTPFDYAEKNHLPIWSYAYWALSDARYN